MSSICHADSTAILLQLEREWASLNKHSLQTFLLKTVDVINSKQLSNIVLFGFKDANLSRDQLSKLLSITQSIKGNAKYIKISPPSKPKSITPPKETTNSLENAPKKSTPKKRQPMDEDIDDKQRKLNESEKKITTLNDIENIDKIGSLQTTTIHRLCHSHNIEIHKQISDDDKHKSKLIENSVLIHKLKEKMKSESISKSISSPKKTNNDDEKANISSIKSFSKISNMASKSDPPLSQHQ